MLLQKIQIFLMEYIFCKRLLHKAYAFRPYPKHYLSINLFRMVGGVGGAGWHTDNSLLEEGSVSERNNGVYIWRMGGENGSGAWDQ